MIKTKILVMSRINFSTLKLSEYNNYFTLKHSAKSYFFKCKEEKNTIPVHGKLYLGVKYFLFLF